MQYNFCLSSGEFMKKNLLLILIVFPIPVFLLAEFNIPPNQWVDAALTYELPSNLSKVRWETTDGYCGSMFRTKNNSVLIRTGVDSQEAGYSPGFYSNTTLEWRPAEQKATIVEIANWGGGSYGNGSILPAFADHPTPTPRHTYDGLTYVEPEDAFYFILGANWRIAAKAEGVVKETFDLDNESTWRFSFADKRWQRINHSVRTIGYRGSPYENHLQHWPEGKKLIFLNDSAIFYAEFDLATQQWAKVELANKSPFSLYNARSTWDSKRALWVFRLGPKVSQFNPATREFTLLPEIYELPTDEKDPRRNWKGITYISKHDVYLATGNTGNDTWVYTPGHDKWKNIQGGNIELVNGYPQYDPSSDLVVLVYQLKAFRFRYQP